MRVYCHHEQVLPGKSGTRNGFCTRSSWTQQCQREQVREKPAYQDGHGCLGSRRRSAQPAAPARPHSGCCAHWHQPCAAPAHRAPRVAPPAAPRLPARLPQLLFCTLLPLACRCNTTWVDAQGSPTESMHRLLQTPHPCLLLGSSPQKQWPWPVLVSDTISGKCAAHLEAFSAVSMELISFSVA